MNYKIPFNKPYLTGKEVTYIEDAVKAGQISGDGIFTKKCHEFFEREFGFRKCLLTTSCTTALEMAAILLNIAPGDEVIMPSFTFVSTANAFVLRGAKIVFADSCSWHPNIDADKLENLITPHTKAIVVVHYAGIACDMDAIMKLANRYNLFVVEDAAHSIDSYYKGKPLGSIGHLATFSFHETKNIMAGEGGMIVINDELFIQRAEVIREKGTNRSAFFRGEIQKYSWVDIGSSFLPSEITAAFLYAQLENTHNIQSRRKQIWDHYYQELHPLEEEGLISLPVIPEYASNNAHMMYVICRNGHERRQLIDVLRHNKIMAVFHYLSLHKSEYYKSKHDGRKLPNSDHYSDCLVRLPMYYELTQSDTQNVIDTIKDFFRSVSAFPYSENCCSS